MKTQFKVSVKYTKQLENGTFKRVTEPYIVFAITFSDAEARIHEELGQFIKGEFLVSSIDRVNFRDYFKSDDQDTWCEIKISYLKAAEDGDREIMMNDSFMITAELPEKAISELKLELSALLIDFEVKSCKKSKIIDVFPFAVADDQQHIELDSIN